MNQVNHLPPQDMKNAETGCCPRFNPEGWEGQVFALHNKTFVKASTRSFMFMPLNMGSVMSKTWATIKSAGADDEHEFVMLTQDVSPWKADHYFWTTKEVPGQQNVTLSGDFVAKVFEGPYKNAKQWHQSLRELAASKGAPNAEIYFYYTTCPKCAKTYGKNYVVGFVKIG